MTTNVTTLLEELEFEPSEEFDNVFIHGPIAVRWVEDDGWAITAYSNRNRYLIAWESHFGPGTPAAVVGAAIEAALEYAEQSEKRELIKLFYPNVESCVRWWGGWNDFFQPCIPNRLMEIGSTLLQEALTSKNVNGIVRFLGQSHVKKLSLSGRGESDVICYPTEKAKKAVELFLKFGTE